LFRCASRNELSDVLEKHPNTIKYHLNKMMKLGLIKEAEAGKGFVYRHDPSTIQIRNTSSREIVYIQKTPHLTYDLIITHKNSIFDDEISKALLYLIEKEPPPSRTDKIYTFDTTLNKIIDFYEELIPMPFCA
jgi:hypothetical protein